MTAPAGQRQRLRGNRAMCATCKHLFGSVAAFDRHLRPLRDQIRGEPACLTVTEFTRPHGKAAKHPRLVWSPYHALWVTRLDDRDHDREDA